MFEHQTMIISLFQLSHMFLKYTNTQQLYVIIWSHQDRAIFFSVPLLYPWSSSTATDRPRTPPTCRRETTGHRDVPSPAEWKQLWVNRIWLSKKKRRGRHMQDSITDETKPLSHTWQILTLFLCALTDAYRTVPLNPATGRGWQIKTGIVIKWWCWWYLTCLWLVSNKIFRHKLLICFLLQTEIWRTR